MSLIEEVYIKEEICVKEEEIELDYQDVQAETEMKKYDESHIKISEQINQLAVPKKSSPSQCIYCRKTFSVDCDLKYHIRTHTGEKPYECSQCNKVFAQSWYLKRHMKTHTGEKPYMCSSCGKFFPELKDLKKHMMTHTGEKAYWCSHCDIGYTNKCSLVNHLRKHTLDNLHSGTEAALSDQGTLTSLTKIDTKVNPYLYQCSHCDMIFSNRRLLESHIRSQHKEKLQTIRKQYKCSTCDETFAIINCINDQKTNNTNYNYKCNRCVDSFVKEKFLINHLQDVEYMPSEIKTEESNPQNSEGIASDYNSLKRSSRKRKIVEYVDDLNPKKAAKTQCISCKKEFTNIYIHVFKSSFCQNSYDMDLFKRQVNEAKREKRLRKTYLYRQRQMAKDSEGFRAKQAVIRNASRKRQRDKKRSEIPAEIKIIEKNVEEEIT